MAYLLDTHVLSEPKRKKPDPKVLQWIGDLSNDSFYISVLSLGEIEQGIVKLGDTRQARDYRDWLESTLTPTLEGRILDIDQRVARVWGQLTGGALRIGRPLSVTDSLLAATALTHQLTFVTRNTKDVSGLSVPTFNPWEEL